MKIEKSEIALKLKNIKNIMPPKNLDVASGILVKDGKLIATNTELTVIANLGEVDTGDPFVIPQKAIPLIESLPQGMIDIKATKTKVTVSGASSKSTFLSYDVKSFPDVISQENSETSEMKYTGENLKTAIESVWASCNPKSSKTAMQGILFEGNGSVLNIVACDGYRASWTQLSCPYEMDMIVPKTTLQKVLQLINDEDEVVISSARGSRNALIKTGEYEIYTRLIDGTFIDYKRIFETSDKEIVQQISRAEFLSCVSRCHICQDISNGAAVLTKNDEGVNLSINSTTTSFSEDIETDVKGANEDFKIGFNTVYMMEALKSCNKEDVTLRYRNTLKPMVIEDGNTPLKHIILPVRLPE